MPGVIGYNDQNNKIELEVTQKTISIEFLPQTVQEFKDAVGLKSYDTNYLPENHINLLPESDESEVESE